MCLDVFIVVCGGGFIEDFWLFNEEIVVWVVVVSWILVIFVVGYEMDMIFIDFVVDKWVFIFIVVVEMVVLVCVDLIVDVKDFEVWLFCGGFWIIESNC